MPVRRALSPLSDSSHLAGTATAGQHQAVLAAAQAGVGRFSTAAGPDGGNLACVWAVRHLIREALGYWVSLSDNTDEFAAELLAHFGGSFAERDVRGGGIIVSPSEGTEGTPDRVVGHIGLLGPGSGAHRRIYSNRSAGAVWMDHYSITTWQARFSDDKGLATLFFPLPNRSCSGLSGKTWPVALDLLPASP